MKKMLIPLCLCTILGEASATPASTEYVNTHLNDGLSALEQKLNTRMLDVTAFCEASATSASTSTESINVHLTDALSTLEQKINVRMLDVASGLQQQIVNGTPITHVLGDNHQGGIIFWLDDTKQHGLIAAKIDANEGQGMQWQNGESGEKITNARANGIRGGLSNTQIIIAQQTMDDQLGNFAALVASSFSVDADGEHRCVDESEVCFSDWYLPSLFELKLMKSNLYLQGVGNISGEYWSSNEQNVNHALSFSVETGETHTNDKSMDTPKIRPIRVF